MKMNENKRPQRSSKYTCSVIIECDYARWLLLRSISLAIDELSNYSTTEKNARIGNQKKIAAVDALIYTSLVLATREIYQEEYDRQKFDATDVVALAEQIGKEVFYLKSSADKLMVYLKYALIRRKTMPHEISAVIAELINMATDCLSTSFGIELNPMSINTILKQLQKLVKESKRKASSKTSLWRSPSSPPQPKPRKQ